MRPASETSTARHTNEIVCLVLFVLGLLAAPTHLIGLVKKTLQPLTDKIAGLLKKIFHPLMNFITNMHAARSPTDPDAAQSTQPGSDARPSTLELNTTAQNVGVSLVTRVTLQIVDGLSALSLVMYALCALLYRKAVESNIVERFFGFVEYYPLIIDAFLAVAALGNMYYNHPRWIWCFLGLHCAPFLANTIIVFSWPEDLVGVRLIIWSSHQLVVCMTNCLGMFKATKDEVKVGLGIRLLFTSCTFIGVLIASILLYRPEKDEDTLRCMLWIRSIVGQAILVITVGYPKKYFHYLIVPPLVKLVSLTLDVFARKRQKEDAKPAESIRSTGSAIGLVANSKRCDTEHNFNNELRITV